MLAPFGDDLLWVALLIAGAASVAGFLAKAEGPLLRVTRVASLVLFLLVLGSFLFLVTAFVQSDFSVLAVYRNSHTDKPLFYKIAGAWGNHEGSILLWTLIASFYGALFATSRAGRTGLLAARTMGTQALLVFGFISYVLFASDPFAPAWPVPEQGLGLNPLLQDPALSFHPPMLYMGYVGFSLVFSLAIAGLLTKSVTREWAAAARLWTLLAWSCLGAGIALGSWWAYYELGWGGWWFWDPVENASLIPWLSGTALLHSLITVEKRGSLKAWTVLLALLTFAFCLIGTFLVRSGIITSVHAFALDPARGVFILLLVGLVIGGGLLLFGLRAHTLTAENTFEPLSRESLLSLNNIFLFTAALTVLTGTLYPLILDLLAAAPLSVGPPYYEATFTPLMMPLILLMGLAPFVAWGQDNLWRVLEPLKLAGLVSLAAMLVLFMLYDAAAFRFYLGTGLAVWLLAATALPAWKNRRIAPMTLAHIGVAISLFGMVASSHLSSDTVALLKPGESLKLAGLNFRFEDVKQEKGPNYIAEQAQFRVTSGSGVIAILHPERRYYPAAEKILSEVAIATNGFRDIYLVLGDVQKDDSGAVKGWNVRAHYNPLVPWIWLGVLLMASGGLFGVFRIVRASSIHARNDGAA